MTVRELIEQLSQFEPDINVQLIVDDVYQDLTSVTLDRTDARHPLPVVLLDGDNRRKYFNAS